MKKLSTCIIALITALFISSSIVPAYAATTCENTSSAVPVSLPVISHSEEESFLPLIDDLEEVGTLPVIDDSEEIGTLPVLDHCIEPEDINTIQSIEDYINDVEVCYRNGMIAIYYGSRGDLVTWDCSGFLIVECLPSEGIVRMYYNTSDGEFHIVELVVSHWGARLIELPQTSGGGPLN